jgi:N-acetylglucosamine kinase-like BadF-type ATPase
MSHLLLGIDGGGTKTIAVLAERGGRELARHTVGGSNPNVAGLETAAGRLLEVIDACCSTSGVDAGEISAAVMGIAGVGHEEHRLGLEHRLRRQYGSGLNFAIVTDARIALEGALGGKPGIAVIAGTGSVTIAKSPDGQVSSVGGWGRVLGDEGSGYALGVEAAKAFARDLDGVANAPAIREAIISRVGWKSRKDLLAAAYHENFELSNLAPLVLDLAEGGDLPSIAILQRGAAAIAAHVAVMAKVFGSSLVLVATCGSLIDHPTSYRRILSKSLEDLSTNLSVISPERNAVGGALLLADSMMEKPLS